MKKIGIVIAMEEEFQAIENKIKEIKVHEEKGLKFFEGKIGEKECVIVKSGVGKVNAARTTQAMIDNFDIEYIINMGASGSIANDLNIGDIVIGKYVVQHDFDITAFGHNKGYITGVGEKVECDKKLIKTLEDVAKNNGKYKVKLGIVVTKDDDLYLIQDEFGNIGTAYLNPSISSKFIKFTAFTAYFTDVKKWADIKPIGVCYECFK